VGSSFPSTTAMARDPRLPPPMPDHAAANPYAAPAAHVADVAPGTSEAEAIRVAHIRHERQVKAVGTLYYLGGALTALAAIVFWLGPQGPLMDSAFSLGIAAVYTLLAAAWLVLGYGFRRMRPWVRVPGGILSALGLLAIPVGTLVNAWVLWIMFSAKGQVILSPTYDAIVAATPHVKYRWTVGDKIATTIIVLVLLGVVALFALPQFVR
jgi:hypothetical protein